MVFNHSLQITASTINGSGSATSDLLIIPQGSNIALVYCTLETYHDTYSLSKLFIF